MTEKKRYLCPKHKTPLVNREDLLPVDKEQRLISTQMRSIEPPLFCMTCMKEHPPGAYYEWECMVDDGS